MVKFAIVGIRRTGTTLIRTTINSHPQVRCIGEAFNFGPRFGPRTRGERCDGGYRKYINESPGRRTRDLLWRSASVRLYLNDLYSESDKMAVGFKLMNTQSVEFPAVFRYLKRNNVSIIHVV